MSTNIEPHLSMNLNPVLSVTKDGTILYANAAGEPLLQEWGVRVGEKVPLIILDHVQRVVSCNSPEKIEVKVGKKVYLIVFHPSPEEECVKVSGFDISEQKEFKEINRDSESQEKVNVELAEVVDIQAIKPLMEDFYKLTHIPIGLNYKGKVLLGVGWQDICTKFHRVNPETCKHCVESNTILSVGVPPGEFKLYKCKNNMWDATTPLMVGSEHVGNIFAGQFFFEDEPLDYDIFRSQARKYGFNEEEYIKALEKVPRLSRDTVETGMSFFTTFANMISQLSYSNVKLAKSLSERDTLFKALRISELKYLQIMETAQEGIWIIDRNDQTVFVNQRFSEMLGYNINEIMGQIPQKFLSPEFRTVADDRLREHRQRVRQAIDYRFIKKDGSDLWCIVSTHQLFDDEGKYAGSLGMLTDITQRKQAEEALRQSEKRYRMLHDSLRDAFVQVSMDGQIIDFNETYCQMLGYSPEEIRTFTYKELTPDPWHSFEDSIIREQILPRGYSDIYEKELRRKDGTVFPVELRTILSRDDAGQPSAMWAILRDITERKQVEEEVLDTKNMLQLIMNNIPQAIFWKDCNSRYVGCNKVFAEDAGVQSTENIVGKNDYDMPWTLEQTEWYRECDRRVMKNDTPEYHIIEQQTTTDGKLTWLDTNKIPLHDAKGNVIGVLGTYEDITERKEAEESLRLLNLYNRNLIETSLDPLVTIGHDGKITDVNKATEQVTGYSRNELIGTDFSDYFTEPEKARAGYQHVFTEGKVWDYPLEIQNKDGHITPVLYNASVYRDENDEVIGVFAAARDITERKKAEDKLKVIHENLERLVRERTNQLEKAYSSLKQSEGRLAEAQRIAHVGNWDWNIVTNALYWSDEIYRIFGRNPQEFGATYDAFLSYLHPEDREYVNNAVVEALNGKSYSIDHRIILANGEERIVHEQGEVIFDEKNIPIRMMGTVQDITERKKAEERIQILADAVESSNDAIVTRSLDDIIIGWNKGAEQIHGYSAEEVLGKHISILEPDSLRGETIRFSEMIKQGKTIQQYETSRLRKDGTKIDVSLTLSPVFSAFGELLAISAIARDITESKRAKEKLRESEEKYRNIVETANEGIAIIDSRGIVTFANKKLWDMLGYSVDESYNKSAFDLIEDVDAFKRKLNDRRKGMSDIYELKAVRKDGSKLWVLASVKPLFNEKGEYLGSLGMFTDISKRKKAEETLSRIEIARKQEIHHRIKNNLQVISSLLDLQAEKFKGKQILEEKEVQEAFKESQDRVISMALIHEELHKGGEIDTLNFSNYVKELTENLLLSYRIENECISLVTEIEENTFFDMDTAVPLGIIINELVSNSLKHAFTGRNNGEIHINLYTEEIRKYKTELSTTKTFILSISDNGVGIPEDIDIENLDSLGLQLLTTLVEQLDGELEMRRDNGTKFIIKFTLTEKLKEENVPADEESVTSDKTTQLTLPRFCLPE